MREKIKWAENKLKRSYPEKEMKIMELEEVEKARRFQKSFSEYAETPLVNLTNLAEFLGLSTICIKDESYRFNLNSFKALGASYAMGNYIARLLNKDIDELDYKTITSDEVRKKIGDITFFATTDGNHGRAVAWTANRLKQKMIVYMPKGSSQSRLLNIRKEGADVSILDLNYDDAIRYTIEETKKVPNGVIVQDTSWEGYEDIPNWIMEGYGTTALEAYEQLKKMDIERPTHIFLQAGVGCFAAAAQGFFANVYKDDPPIVTIVESNKADCYYKSIIANDGEYRTVGGDMDTIMVGLACGEPNPTTWNIIKNNSLYYVSCPDWVTARGMRILGNPLKVDTKVISGESGAVTLGLLTTITMFKEYEDLKNELKLDKNSKVLLFSTEGDTFPERYRSIVWDGEYSSVK